MGTNNELLIRLAREVAKTMSLPDADIVTKLCTQLDCALAAARTACGERTAAHSTIEKAREVTNCPEGVDLQDHLKQLVAENAFLLSTMNEQAGCFSAALSEGFHDAVMASGIEHLIDIYHRRLLPAIQCVPPTPATDSILRAAEARGGANALEKFAEFNISCVDKTASEYSDHLTETARAARAFAAKLREGKA